MCDITATYSPEDNKLRLYAASRLDRDLFLRVRAAGYKWAPKQELFVAPMWTPSREALAIELAGEISDEDTSLVDRAEMKAERFEEYSDKRANEAIGAKNAVSAIADGIPFGQPILVGHHSEKRARKDAERIENGMRKAVNLWETSKYWTMRAAGAVRSASYKERPDVRARRIKKIEADTRKRKASYTPNPKIRPTLQTPWYCPVCSKYSCGEHPEAKEEVTHVYCGNGRGGSWMQESKLPAIEKACARWIAHNDNRLVYEKAMLEAQGGSELLKPKKRAKQAPILNYRCPGGFTVTNPSYYAEKISHLEQVEMTKAEYQAIHKDSRGVYNVDAGHRVKYTTARHIPAMMEGLTGLAWNNAGYHRVAVFLTDSKIHSAPEKIALSQSKIEEVREIKQTATYTPPERTEFDDLKDSLKKGVQVAVAPQLFPTPKDIAQDMADLLDINPGDRVLEPSAGTGNLIGAVGCTWRAEGGELVAVELNNKLCQHLEFEFPLTDVRQGDFLQCNGDFEKFDRIIMNPPFINGEDIKHIKHAITFLKPGGKLVALCANGPRQQKQLQPLCDHWEELPDGSFKASGTGVNVAMLVITN